MAAVLVLAAVLGALGILVALAALATFAMLVLRAELAGVVAGLRGLAEVPLRGFGAGGPLGRAPRRIPGAARVLRPGRPGLPVPGLMMPRLVLGRQRPEGLIRAPGVTAGRRRRLRPLPHGRVLGYARRLGHAIVRPAPGIAPPAGILGDPGRSWDPGTSAGPGSCPDPAVRGDPRTRVNAAATAGSAAIRLRSRSRAGSVAGPDELAGRAAGGAFGIQGGLQQDGRGGGVDHLATGAGVLTAAA